jgi:glycosyltransferase involved in cell wall biosynthesis
MRILVLVPGDVGTHMSGPAIRAWMLAQGLSESHEVTAAIDGKMPDAAPDGLRIFQVTRPRFLRETLRHDVVISGCPPPYAVTAARASGAIMVADLYDPVELELQTIDGRDRLRQSVRTLRRYHHRYADLVLCAGQAQRRMLLEELDSIGRVGASAPAVGIVPYGLPEAPERSGETPIRHYFPQIKESDRIVLWWGKIWSWFDSETAIKAFVPLAESRPEIKLVITAGKAPDPKTDILSQDAKARELARQYGLLDKTVFFVNDWIPFAERHHWLQEADLGLTMHANSPEAEYAARARYMDYLWAGLPCVLARGDEVADEFAEAGAAVLVEPGDAEAVTRAMIELLDDPDALRQAGDAAVALAGRYRWNAIARDLNTMIEQVASAPRASKSGSLRALAEAGAYYGLRVRARRH